jgi:hypothetical protein
VSYTNLRPKCRRHHRAKQAPGWRVEQPEPGVTRWTLPNGRLTVQKLVVKTVPLDSSKFRYGMPTICDPLPAADGSVSLADFAAIRAIRAVETGPFSDLHPRAAPLTPLSGAGLGLADVAAALGSAEPMDGVVIDTLGAGFIPGSFAFRLPDDGHVYGYCVGAEVVVLGLHRSRRRRELPAAAAGLADLMRQFSLDLIVWPYAERVSDIGALESWYRSGRKMPW